MSCFNLDPEADTQGRNKSGFIEVLVWRVEVSRVLADFREQTRLNQEKAGDNKVEDSGGAGANDLKTFDKAQEKH